MFDDVCLVCGKFLDVDNTVYCSPSCEAADAPEDADSPALSSSSSLFTSSYASSSTSTAPLDQLADIPPLMLDDGSSVFEYDDRDAKDAFLLLPAYESDAVPGHKRKKSQSLAFNRRPSPVDTRALAPVLHRQSSNSSSSIKSRHSHSHSHPHFHSHTKPNHDIKAQPMVSPLLQKRTRASLPAYFSHLQLAAHTHTQVPLPLPSAPTPTPDATPRRREGSDRVYAPIRARSGSRNRSTKGHPMPGSHEREREQAREQDVDVERPERRGRSRAVTPRVKLLDS